MKEDLRQLSMVSRFVFENLSASMTAMAGQEEHQVLINYHLVEHNQLLDLTYVCLLGLPCHHERCVPWSTSYFRLRSEEHASTSYMGQQSKRRVRRKGR